MTKGKINAIKRPRKVVQRTSFGMSKAAHNALNNIVKLEKVSRAEAIDEVVFLAAELEKHSEQFTIEPRKKAASKPVRKTYAVFVETLKQIEKRALSANTNRDIVLENLVLQIEPRLTHDECLRRRQYLQLYENDIRPLRLEMEKVLKTLQQKLDADDLLLYIFQKQAKTFYRMVSSIKGLLPNDIE